MIRTKRRTEGRLLGLLAVAALALAAAPAGAQPAGDAPPAPGARAGSGARARAEPAPAPAAEPAPAPAEPPVAAAAPATPVATAPAAAAAPAADEALPPAPSTALSAAQGPEAQSHAAAHSDFMDTRLTWTFGDDDFKHQTGDALPLSPNANVGDRPQYRLFFDSLNSRFSGRENLTQLVLYNHMPGYWPRLDTEAALVLRVDLSQLASQSNNVNAAFEDAGTYIRLFYRMAGTKKAPEGLGMTFYPIDTDRFRLGYLYDISWGGTNARINQSIFPRLQGSSPGLKAQYDGKGWYLFAGFKTASIVEVQQRIVDNTSGEGSSTDTVRVAETNYGFLGGGGVDIMDHLRVDAGTGYFQQGRFEDADVIGKRIYTYGYSGRIVVHDGMPVPRSVDFALYRNDPNAPMKQFAAEEYTPGKVTWAVSLEGTQLLQNLKDFDAAGKTAIQPARAAAAQANVKIGYLSATLSAIYRDLPFVLRNQPSFIPFQTLPKDAKTQDEMFFALAADYYIESLRLTPGIGGGLQLPATFRSESVDAFGNDTSRTIVVRQQGDLAFLPAGDARVPIIQARASLKWDLSRMLSTVAWLQYRRDNNATRLELDPTGTVLQRRFLSPDFIGAGISVQARF